MSENFHLTQAAKAFERNAKQQSETIEQLSTLAATHLSQHLTAHLQQNKKLLHSVTAEIEQHLLTLTKQQVLTSQTAMLSLLQEQDQRLQTAINSRRIIMQREQLQYRKAFFLGLGLGVTLTLLIALAIKLIGA